MKKLTTFFIGILLFIKLPAQENISFSQVIQTDSVGITLIFETINAWFATTYKSAKDVIQMADKDAGVIIGNGTMNYSFGKMGYLCYDGYITYTIKVNIKDNRYRVELINFKHSVKAGNSPQCALGFITTSEKYAESGMSKNYQNNVWSDIKLKAEQYSNEIFESLANSTKSIKDTTVDNW